MGLLISLSLPYDTFLFRSCARPFDGALTVSRAPLAITAGDVAKSYGQTPVLSAFTPVGLQNGETIGAVTETSTGAAAATSVAGGPYAITATGASGGSFSAANYAITFFDGALTVSRAPLAITAGDVAKSYGQTPVLSAFTPVGLQNGETIGSVSETSPGTVATASVAGGPARASERDGVLS